MWPVTGSRSVVFRRAGAAIFAQRIACSWVTSGPRSAARASRLTFRMSK